MIKPFIQPVRRRRGNPNWGRPLPPAPAVATEFEMQVRHLRLTKQTCTGSVALQNWCERNKNRCYIPEWLLEEWGITVERRDPPIKPALLAESRLVRYREKKGKMPYEEFRKLFEQRPEPNRWQRIRLGSSIKWAPAGGLCVIAVLLMR